MNFTWPMNAKRHGPELQLQTENLSIYNINQIAESLGHILNVLMINWHAFFIIIIYIFLIKYISKIIHQKT